MGGHLFLPCFYGSSSAPKVKLRFPNVTSMAQALEVGPFIPATLVDWHDVVGLDVHDAAASFASWVACLVQLRRARPLAATRTTPILAMHGLA